MTHMDSMSQKHWLQRLFGAGLFCVVAMLPMALHAASIDPFVGSYHGTTIEHAEGELQARDLDVVIQKTERGFTVDWATVIHKADGREKNVSLNVEFFTTERRTSMAARCVRACLANVSPMIRSRANHFSGRGLLMRP